METLKEKILRLKEEGKALRREIQERLVSYIVAAFGLVAGLAWNDAVKALIEYYFPKSQETLTAKFVYAIAISVIIVFLSIYLMRFLGKRDDKK